MAAFDDPQEGFVFEDSPGAARPNLGLTCRACKHYAVIHYTTALKFWSGMTIRRICRSLRCTKCGERQGMIQLVTPHGPFPGTSGEVTEATVAAERVRRCSP